MLLTQSEFNKLVSEGYNRIPVVYEVLADLDTPVSVYLKLANQPYSYLLESVQGGEKWGRYSFIGLPCKTRIRVNGFTTTVETDEGVVEQFDGKNPLDVIEAYQQRFKVPELDGLPRFSGGLVGYFGYETIRYIETHLNDSQKPDVIGADDILLMVSEELAVFDNLSGKMYLIIYADSTASNAYEMAQDRLKQLVQLLTQPISYEENQNAQFAESGIHYHFPEDKHAEAIDKCRQYIYDGDIFQVVLSQRFSMPFRSSPIDLYRSLRMINPSPYMYYLHLDDLKVVGCSPEILVRLEDDEVTLRPIAGTRHRGASEQEDIALEENLLADEKELAEHLMLVDLGRNDVGRIVKPGTVDVTDMMTIERYSHVMHIVSNVVGDINEGMTAIDVLKATFPAGTVSGAPKVRAMEIIDELEPEKRGVYSGAIGYIGWNGNMDTAIAIRTAVIKDEVLYIQAGGGIVADSVARNEWQETVNKSNAVLKAAESVLKGALHNDGKKGDLL